VRKKSAITVKSTEKHAHETDDQSDWEALLTEMRKAREYGVPGIGARKIAGVERKLEKIRRNCENMRAIARMLLDSLGKSSPPPTNDTSTILRRVFKFIGSSVESTGPGHHRNRASYLS
jgi:hypothetical protein